MSLNKNNEKKRWWFCCYQHGVRNAYFQSYSHLKSGTLIWVTLYLMYRAFLPIFFLAMSHFSMLDESVNCLDDQKLLVTRSVRRFLLSWTHSWNKTISELSITMLVRDNNYIRLGSKVLRHPYRSDFSTFWGANTFERKYTAVRCCNIITSFSRFFIKGYYFIVAYLNCL